MKKNEFEEIIELNKEYLLEYNYGEILENSSFNSNQEINQVYINLDKLSFFNINKEEDIKATIYFFVKDKNKEIYIDYSTYFNVKIKYNKNNKFKHIILEDKISILNKIKQYDKDNYEFKFLIIPMIDNYPSIDEKDSDHISKIVTLDKKLFRIDSSFGQEFENTKILDSFLLNSLKLVILLLGLYPILAYNFLVTKAGFVESLINFEVIISSSSFLFIEFFSNLFEKITSVFFIGLVIILVEIIVIVYSFYKLETFISFFNCKKDRIIIKEIRKSRFNTFFHSSLKLLKEKNFYLITGKSFSLSVLIVLIAFFYFEIRTYFNDDLISNVDKISNKYVKLSKFPSLSKIRINNMEEKVLFMGYDKVYSYYYSLEYLDKLLKNKDKVNMYLEFCKKNKKKEFCSKAMNFSFYYRNIFFKKLDNENIIAIKNDNYIFEQSLDISLTLKEFNLYSFKKGK